MKRALNLGFWLLIIMGLVVSLGFVHDEQRRMVCNDLKIIVNGENEHEFIDVNDINSIINNTGNSIIGRSLAGIDIGELERLIENNPSVANAEVYKTINGEINIKVKQKNPLLRIFPITGEGFYIDEDGEFMPLSMKYSARVLPVNGYIHGGLNNWQGLSIKTISENDSLAAKTLLDDLFVLAEFIKEDDFLRSQVLQVYVNENKEIELIPRVGNHRIIIGDVSGLKEKFEKLLIFYKEGLSKTGWNEYEVINLKFENQIVCTKIKQ
jgi:cell division protein FtsQ